MRSNKKYVLFFLFVTFCISDCKKYSDDSKSPHLRTVKERLAGGCFSKGKYWDAGGVFRLSDNATVTGRTPSDNIYFSKDGSFWGAYASYPNLYFKGTWEFIDKKNKLSITNNSSGVASEYTGHL